MSHDPMGIYRALVGKAFGRWLVITVEDKHLKRKALCRCLCGTEKWVSCDRLKRGGSRSCGCLRREVLRVATLTHGETRGGHSAEYRLWSHIKGRCLNPNEPYFKDYGGRGITICERWLNSFENFLADVGRKPGPEFSLDRYPDNDGNYEPGNVRWATRHEQANNTRANRWVEFNGKTLTLSQWARRLGVKPATLGKRLRRCGWSIVKLLKEHPTMRDLDAETERAIEADPAEAQRIAEKVRRNA